MELFGSGSREKYEFQHVNFIIFYIHPWEY